MEKQYSEYVDNHNHKMNNLIGELLTYHYLINNKLPDSIREKYNVNKELQKILEAAENIRELNDKLKNTFSSQKSE